MTSTLVCDSNREVTSTFTNAGIAEDNYISMDIDAIATSPIFVYIKIEYKKDDI